MDIVPQKDNPQGLKMKIKEQKNEGAIYFDNEAGQLVESKTTGKMKMEINFGGQEIEQDIEITQTFRLAPPEAGQACRRVGKARWVAGQCATACRGANASVVAHCRLPE